MFLRSLHTIVFLFLLRVLNSPLVMSAFIVNEFDRENEVNCINYKCSAKLLAQKGVKLDADCARGATVFHYAGMMFVVIVIFALM